MLLFLLRYIPYERDRHPTSIVSRLFASTLGFFVVILLYRLRSFADRVPPYLWLARTLTWLAKKQSDIDSCERLNPCDESARFS